MPTKPRREDIFIERFLSAYQEGAWAKANIDWLDQKRDGAVEALATRVSDGATLAIEHTIIQPFVGDKEDFAAFSKRFLEIGKDTSLLVPNRWIRVFVPVGILSGRHRPAQQARIVEAIHAWIRDNRLSLELEESTHRCAVGIGAEKDEVVLTIRVVPLAGAGKLHVRRQQIEESLGVVVEKALRSKLPKLTGTTADSRILLLERQHMNLLPERIIAEVDKQRLLFPELQLVDEIWVLETIAYETTGYLRFERYESNKMIDCVELFGPESS